MGSADRPLVAVTGASRGIGRAVALAFARAGARVVMVARSRETLARTAKEVEAAGGSPVTVPADVSRDADASAIAAAVDGAGGVLDALVNNAGLFRSAPILESDLQRHWHDLLAANLTGTFLPTLRCLPALLRARRPHVLNVLSVAALRGFPGNAGYGASKWGARGLGECLRAELGDRLRVTSVYPGATDTDAWDGVAFPHDRSKMLRPEAVADAIVAAWRAEPAPEEVVLETPPGAVG